LVKQYNLLGKVCPFPVIDTLKAYSELKKGDILEVLIDDPLAKKSIPDELSSEECDVDIEDIDRGWKIIIKKR